MVDRSRISLAATGSEPSTVALCSASNELPGQPQRCAPACVALQPTTTDQSDCALADASAALADHTRFYALDDRLTECSWTTHRMRTIWQTRNLKRDRH